MQQVEPPFPATGTARPPSHLWGILRRLWPYLLMVVWAVAGLAYTDLYPQRSVPFWQLTTVVFAADRHRARLPGRRPRPPRPGAQAAGPLGRLPGCHGPAPLPLRHRPRHRRPLGIVTLILLALATFLDGVYVDWRFCVVGVVLAIGVILVAVLDDAALGIFVVGAVALAALYALRHFSFRRAAEA